MARPKGPFSDWVYAEWEELVFEKGQSKTPEERLTLSQSLYERGLADGTWVVGSDDASLMTERYMAALMDFERYEEASQVALTYVEHPDYASADRVYRIHARAWKGANDLLCGKIEIGCAWLKRPFGEPMFKMREYLIYTRLPLGHALDFREDDQATPELNELLSVFIGSFYGMKRLSRKALSATTWGELGEMLDRTYRRVEQERVKQGALEDQSPRAN